MTEERMSLSEKIVQAEKDTRDERNPQLAPPKDWKPWCYHVNACEHEAAGFESIPPYFDCKDCPYRKRD